MATPRKKKADDDETIKVMVSMTKGDKRRYDEYCERKSRAPLSLVIRQAMDALLERDPKPDSD